MGRGSWSPHALQKAVDLTNELYSQKHQATGNASGVSDGLRAAFKHTVCETIETARTEACYSPADWPRIERKIERYAIERALVAHDILQVRRTEIPLPIKSIFAARVS